MAKRTSPKQKTLGKAYWAAVAAAAEGKRGAKTKASLIRTCSRGRGVSEEECAEKVKAGLKGRRSRLKSGKPRKRKLSQTKAAKAARAGFKAAVAKCKTKKNVQSCMAREAPKQIAKRQ